MKYFTKEWCFGDLSDDQIDERLESYKNYINSVYKNLPFVLKIIAKNLNLHDGKITKTCFIQDKKNLILEGIFGDLQSGYYFMQIKYLDISMPNAEFLASIFNNSKIEILSDEIEIFSENLFSHKLIFSTKQEIDICFKDIQIAIQNAQPNNYKNSPCIFEIV